MLHTGLVHIMVGFGTYLNQFLFDKRKSTYQNLPAVKWMLERSSKYHSEICPMNFKADLKLMHFKSTFRK